MTNMTKIQIATFPGRVQEYVLEPTTTVKDALEIAGITVGAEQEVKLDGTLVSMDSTIGEGNLLLVTKRLKGAK